MPDITPDREALARLRASVANAERALAEARARAETSRDGRSAVASATKANARARAELLQRLQAFAAQNDPRSLMSSMDDGIPLLLFPLRVETRFKQTGDSTELWVRVYPDACLIESFDELLSASEVSEARRFWMRWWRAGGVDADQRAAWASLVAATGSSRATWVVRTFLPLNDADAPKKVDPTETIIVVSINPLPSSAERTALATYWTALWRDPSASATARAALDAAVGSARAAELIAAVPFNLLDDPPAPLTRDTAPMRVVFLALPDDPLTTTSTWNSAPVVRTLPERLVLRAERGADPPLEVVGNAIPSPLVAGPDPQADSTDQLSQTDGVLNVPPAIRWMVDFDEAVKIGMGFRVPLTPQQAANGFDRVLVLGVRQTSAPRESADTLATLIAHHRFGATGFAIVPQGTPTNNTETATSGFDRRDNPDASYDATFIPPPPPTSVWEDKLDGQWLAELLGIPQLSIDGVERATSRDQIVGRAMGTALWPATLGYTLETLMHPIFSADTVDGLRWFHNNFVSGRGWVPAVRVGKEPYGILPTSAMRRWGWVTSKADVPADGAGAPSPAGSLLVPLLATLRRLETDWDTMSQQVSAVGRAGDPHQLLLDILGLHPTSVEYYQRYAQSLDSIRARVRLLTVARNSASSVLDTAAWQNDARALLRQLGYNGATDPDILSRIFYGAQQLLQGPLIDDRLLSEADPVRAYTDDGRNYLQWMIDAARVSLDELRSEQGFSGNVTPTALLYLMLRHALILGYWDTSVRLNIAAGILDPPAQATVRREAPFVHVAAGEVPSESRWAMLYSDDVRVTGVPGQIVADHITTILGTLITRHLDEQLAALERLKDVPTAQLERAFAEHVDCASYRLDAWVQGMINAQLSVMRQSAGDNREGQSKPGIHLGAFGWLEEVRPRARQRTGVELPPDLVDFFAPPGAAPLVSDETNGGYMFTPSLNHAVTAAVLRSGYLANSSAANPESFSVNLSSSRVRIARQILEGIRNGQTLGALLGYRFERGLHDRHSMAEVDRFIGALRKQFPLRADRLDETKSLPGVSIEAIEASNVLDGALLVDRVRSSGNASYPFGLDLPAASPDQLAAINAEVDALLDANDAVADLALAESVHQAAQGNFDRAAANLDAYGKGGLPPEPDVIRTPLSGTILTHRVAVHLATDASTSASPVPGVGMTPRAACEPSVNAWLAEQLPTPDRVYCLVKVTSALTGATVTHEITQRDLGLQPIDLLECVVDASTQGMSELEDRITRRVTQTFVQRPDDTISIAFTELLPDRTKVSFFELAPQLRALRVLVSKSRVLRATDLRLAGEAETNDDQTARIDGTRVGAARNALVAARGPLDSAVTALSALLADPVANRAALLAGVDTTVTAAANAATPLLAFGVRAAIGEWYGWRRAVTANLAGTVRERLTRWAARNDEAVARIAAYDLLPGGTPDSDRFTELESIQRLVAASAVVPRPPSVLTSRTQTGDAINAFQARLGALTTAVQAAVPSFSALRAGIIALLPIDAFDVEPFSIGDIEDDVLRHLSELVSTLKTIRTDVDGRLDAAQKFIDAAAATSDATDRVDALTKGAKAVFGDAFMIVPTFDIPVASRGDLDGAMSFSTSGELLHFQTADRANREPVDTWLYGIARVRYTMHVWEQVVMYGEAFGVGSMAFTPIQLPGSPAVRWLALEFPSDTVLDGEHLCYTAHYVQPFDSGAPQCGLLVDEWTEVLPAAEQTAAVAFNFDRPNAEPPQVWLLATPSTFGSGWSWDDVVGAVNEAFERARRRAVEPELIDATPYARFLPAVITATSVFPIAISANLAANNGLLTAEEANA